MSEVWKDIPDYEGYYQVSNTGKVRSLDRDKCDGIRMKGIQRKLHADSCGYLMVPLAKDGKVKHFCVHRLVALAFIPNPDNLPQVNHKDEIRDHNNVENLEWCTVLYNQNYGHRREKTSESSKGEGNGRAVLSADNVKEIRRTYIPGHKEYGIRALANRFGVKYVTIQKIVQGKLWKCLLED